VQPVKAIELIMGCRLSSSIEGKKEKKWMDTHQEMSLLVLYDQKVLLKEM